MPRLATTGIVCAVLRHGENGVIARLLTPDQGLVAGYVRGGRSRALRPVLIPGNIVAATFSVRDPDALASLTVELLTSRAPWHGEPLAAAGIGWATALAAATLAEEQPYPALHLALGALLDAVCNAPSARRWAGALIDYEALVLRELGYGQEFARAADGSGAETMAALKRSRDALARHLFADRRADVLHARDLLAERLQRAIA